VRVAALYDIHGMLEPLEAVLRELEAERVDAIVIGGDAISGPQPLETNARLRELELPVHWIRGNGDKNGPATGAQRRAYRLTPSEPSICSVCFCICSCICTKMFLDCST